MNTLLVGLINSGPDSSSNLFQTFLSVHYYKNILDCVFLLDGSCTG